MGTTRAGRVAGACVVVDLLANIGGLPIGLLTYPLFWLGVYAAGVTWRSGRLLQAPVLAPTLVVVGAAALVLLVVVGPYPVSMLAAVGEEMRTTAHPHPRCRPGDGRTRHRATARHRVRRWCEHRRVWAGVVAVNLVAMSLYLWHMVAALLASLVFWFTGLVGASAAEFHVVVAATALVPRVRCVAAAHRRRCASVRVGDAGSRPGAPDPTPADGPRWGCRAVATGMVALTVTGLTGGPAGVSLLGLAAFVSGAVVVRGATGIVATRSRSPRRTGVPLGPS